MTSGWSSTCAGADREGGQAAGNGEARARRVRAINALRFDAQRAGLRLMSVEQAVAYGQALSDDQLLGIRNFGPKALAWLRTQAPASPSISGRDGSIASVADPTTGWRVALRGRESSPPLIGTRIGAAHRGGTLALDSAERDELPA